MKMLSIPVEQSETLDLSGPCAVGVVSLSGDLEGVIQLTLPIDVAERMATLFVGAAIDRDNPDFTDAIGELVNIVGGGTKAELSPKAASMSVPTVILGDPDDVSHEPSLTFETIDFVSDCGTFRAQAALTSMSNNLAA